MNVTSPRGCIEANLWHYAQEAAAEVGVRLYNLRDSGKGIAFTLKTGEPSELREDWRGKEKLQPKYQRLGQRERPSLKETARCACCAGSGLNPHSMTKEVCTACRGEGTVPRYYSPVVPGAVCWHGHRDFLRALYRRVPDAKVRTAFITYLDAEHFEHTYQETWDGAPDKASRGFAAGYVPYRDACTCDEGGI